jgi:hypothetical protein
MDSTKALMLGDTDPDLVPALRDPALLNAFRPGGRLKNAIESVGQRCGPNGQIVRGGRV